MNATFTQLPSNIRYVLHVRRADIMTYTITKLFSQMFMVTFKFNAQTDNNDKLKRKLKRKPISNSQRHER